MRQKGILDINDSLFFTSYGCLVSLMMWAMSKVNLPANVDRGFLQGLILDHIPLGTIGSLFIAVSFFMLLSVIVENYSIKGFLFNQSQHLSNRISQLSSPAFFVVIGFSIPVFFKYITTKNFVDCAYFITFIIFALVLYLLAKLAREASHSNEKIQDKLHPKLALACCVGLAIAIVWSITTDMRPQKIEVAFDIGIYKQIEAKAKEQNKTVNDFIEHSVLSGLNDSNQQATVAHP